MENSKESIILIKQALKGEPKGMTVTDISKSIGMNRHSVAKYLDVLAVSGQVDMKLFGPSKVFFLSNRVPLSAIIGCTSSSIAIIDSHMRIAFANDNFVSMMKKDRKAIVNRNIRDISIPHSTCDELAIYIKEAINGNNVIKDIEVAGTYKKMFFNVKFVPIVFEDGEKGAALIIEDITWKKNLENALSANSENSRKALETVSDLFFEIGSDLKFTYAGKKMLQLLGYSRSDIEGKGPFDMIPKKETKMLRALFLASQKDRSIIENKSLPFIKKSGEIARVNIIFTPVLDGSNELIGYMCTAKIT
jgi:PAS domain S-box-containing protein